MERAACRSSMSWFLLALLLIATIPLISSTPQCNLSPSGSRAVRAPVGNSTYGLSTGTRFKYSLVETSGDYDIFHRLTPGSLNFQSGSISDSPVTFKTSVATHRIRYSNSHVHYAFHITQNGAHTNKHTLFSSDFSSYGGT